ncbi:MAG: radical SAM protein [Blastocatellia bacterium]|nr:MAG: radical SAM protein [Blastocatellia bacterium]
MGSPVAVLISTYELGRQPFGLASPAAWLRREGWDVDCLDLTKDRLREATIESASLIGFHLPMHTATRLAGPAIVKVRRLNRSAHICAYGLYGPLNEGWLRSIGVDDVLGGEFEEDLAAIARSVLLRPDFNDRPSDAGPGAHRPIPRIHFLVPDRRGLPPLDRYASLHMPDGTRRIVGSTEASRGCKHLCRHCPVVPIYEGQFRIVQPDVVMADIRSQVAAGAQHVTFGDPDFFNGPTHAIRVVHTLHAEFPALSYDVTVKIEHLLKYRHLLPALRDTGCLFVTSAVESVDDRTLALLQKGHTRADFIEAVAECRATGLTLMPTFVAFHPWLTLAGYCELLDTVERLDLVDHVAPIQLAIRLLIPEGSKLLEIRELQEIITGFDGATLTYRWVHADSRVDDLQRKVSELVGVGIARDRGVVFEQISDLAHDRAGIPRAVRPAHVIARPAAVPYLSEPWYCCAEPNPDQVRLV